VIGGYTQRAERNAAETVRESITPLKICYVRGTTQEDRAFCSRSGDADQKATRTLEVCSGLGELSARFAALGSLSEQTGKFKRRRNRLLL
jgi:hypothetical protein